MKRESSLELDLDLEREVSPARSHFSDSFEDGLEPKFHLRELAKNKDPALLEAAASEGPECLQQIKSCLEAQVAKNPALDPYITRIDTIQAETKHPKSLIGVFGKAGDGKSSLINALLDYPHIVPTSGLAAYTSSIIEIAYNHREGPNFRAEIEFLSREEWRQELRKLIFDVLDDDGKPRPRNNIEDDTDIAGAYDKLRRVHPALKVENLRLPDSEDEVVQLARYMHPAVRDAFEGNQLKKLEHDTAQGLHDDLEQYVSNTSGVSSAERGKGHAESPVFWPLVKVARVYVKSAVLQGGAETTISLRLAQVATPL